MEKVVINKKFWRNKKVLITGHSGFKGAWLCLLMQQLEANVFGLSLAPSTNPSLFNLAQIATKCTSHFVDIRDLEQLNKLISNYQPEIVFHLAAQPLVRKSYKEPIDTYSTNIMGTINVLEACKTSESVKSIVVITTDKCYENKEWCWGYREEEALGGYDPYSSSKACVEIIVSAWRRSYFNHRGVGLASARAGNVIGGGDWAEERLIPDIIRSLSEQKTLIIRSPSSVRPWQHVLEPLTGYISLAEHLWDKPNIYGEAWNFGPEDSDAKAVSWIVNKMIKLWGSGTYEIDETVLKELHEAHYLKLDCSKAKNKLNWKPLLNLENALTYTALWYKAFLEQKNMYDFSVMQINNYLNIKKEEN